MAKQTCDVELALFSERILLPLMSAAEIIERLEHGIERFVAKMQLIDPGFSEGLIVTGNGTEDLLMRAAHLERRIAKLEIMVAAATRSVDGSTHACDREIAQLHARIDSISGDIKQRLTALAFRFVEMDMQVRLQQAPPAQ